MSEQTLVLHVEVEIKYSSYVLPEAFLERRSSPRQILMDLNQLKRRESVPFGVMVINRFVYILSLYS